ncbi:MAG: hypothetical protein J0I14_17600 [Propionibacteriaceae bacterium]|jgi:hypothetical protein|nr:hypothetical protein [Propionibacteriaceae bacterium]
MYERLEADAVLATARRLQGRIEARFPGRNLSRVAAQLVTVASEVEQAAARTLPIRVLRIAGLILIATLVVLSVASVVAVAAELLTGAGSTLAWLSAVETIVNDIVYVGIAVVFLWLLPAHVERRRILGELHRLRSLAHVIDMHQLTKDPERFAEAYQPTPRSVQVGLSPIDMAAYLDYCSELLSLVAKTAAVYAERTTDPAVLATISDIENLTSGMARKIWQKLSLLPGLGTGSAGAAR